MTEEIDPLQADKKAALLAEGRRFFCSSLGICYRRADDEISAAGRPCGSGICWAF